MPTVAAVRLDGGYARAIEKLLEHVGGIEKYVYPGQRVLLKPDLMYDYPGGIGLTTDPEFVAAVGRLVKARGGCVVVGDSPFVFRRQMDEFWRETGLKAIAERERFELVSFEMTGSHAIAVDTQVFYISLAVLEADCIINLPRLKPDPWTGFAGAVRNLVGAVPGFQKAQIYQGASGERALARVLVDIFSAVKPTLNIVQMEGRMAPEKAAEEQPCFAAASSDAVALDTVLGEILGLAPERVHTTRLAGDAGLGIAWLKAIRLKGEPLERLKDRFSGMASRHPSARLRRITRRLTSPDVWMKSSVNAKLCDGCGVCARFCPTRALRIAEGSKTPSINYNLCIGCWAGMANCPHGAIDLEHSR